MVFSIPNFVGMLRAKAEPAGLWQPTGFERGAELLRQGEPCSHLLVLTGGLAKLTYLAPSGDEWVKSFIVDEGVFGSIERELSRFGAIAVETSTVVSLPADWVSGAVAADQRLASEVAAFSRWLIKRKQLREEALLCDSAETRYRALLRDEPELLDRLSQADIARYLRVTPVAFSRIKRRVRA